MWGVGGNIVEDEFGDAGVFFGGASIAEEPGNGLVMSEARKGGKTRHEGGRPGGANSGEIDVTEDVEVAQDGDQQVGWEIIPCGHSWLKIDVRKLEENDTTFL